jgi:hypothetical protein
MSKGVEFVRVIKDSISPEGIRLTTIHARYWRGIHSEVMTHRVFSRNARSSRAVPVMTLLSEDPYLPEFASNQRGMQSGEPVMGWRKLLAVATWCGMVAMNKSGVRILHFAGVHKQWANRPLEWFGYIDVLVSSTEWANFFALRCHPDASPELQALATGIYEALRKSTPQLLYTGEWHLPYIDSYAHIEDDGHRRMRYYRRVNECSRRKELPLEEARKISAARCAAISYRPFDGDGSLEKELARFDKLAGSAPIHASPLEHQATPDELYNDVYYDGWKKPHLQGNFCGWIQHRKLLENECIHTYKEITR